MYRGSLCGTAGASRRAGHLRPTLGLSGAAGRTVRGLRPTWACGGIVWRPACGPSGARRGSTGRPAKKLAKLKKIVYSLVMRPKNPIEPLGADMLSRIIAKTRNSRIRNMMAFQISGLRKMRVFRHMKRFIIRGAGSVC